MVCVSVEIELGIGVARTGNDALSPDVATFDVLAAMIDSPLRAYKDPNWSISGGSASEGAGANLQSGRC